MQNAETTIIPNMPKVQPDTDSPGMHVDPSLEPVVQPNTAPPVEVEPELDDPCH